MEAKIIFLNLEYSIFNLCAVYEKNYKKQKLLSIFIFKMTIVKPCKK